MSPWEKWNHIKCSEKLIWVPKREGGWIRPKSVFIFSSFHSPGHCCQPFCSSPKWPQDSGLWDVLGKWLHGSGWSPARPAHSGSAPWLLWLWPSWFSVLHPHLWVSSPGPPLPMENLWSNRVTAWLLPLLASDSNTRGYQGPAHTRLEASTRKGEQVAAGRFIASSKKNL